MVELQHRRRGALWNAARLLKDARTAPGGAALIDNNLMFGADYFLQTWKQCEAEQTHVQ